MAADDRDLDDDFATNQPPERATSHVGLIVGILAAALLLCCGGFVGVGFWLFNRGKDAVEQAQMARDQANLTANAPGPATPAEQSRGNLQRIASAMERYHDAHSAVVNNSYDDQASPKSKPSGRPLLSWRVHLLPFLDESDLYRQFQLDEPWDSPNNIRLLDQMPAVYGTPEANQRAGAGKTFYRGFSNRGAVFEKPPRPDVRVRHIIPASFPEGTSTTLAVLEAGEPVEWTKPADIDWSLDRPRPSLGGIAPELPYCQCLMMDTSVARLRKDVPDQTLRSLIMRKDRKALPDNWRHR